MAGLTPAQLAKRNNFAIFKRRIKKGEPFTKVGGGKVKLGFADRKLNEEFLKTLTSAPALKNTLPKTASRALAVPVVNGDPTERHFQGQGDGSGEYTIGRSRGFEKTARTHHRGEREAWA